MNTGMDTVIFMVDLIGYAFVARCLPFRRKMYGRRIFK